MALFILWKIYNLNIYAVEYLTFQDEYIVPIKIVHNMNCGVQTLTWKFNKKKSTFALDYFVKRDMNIHHIGKKVTCTGFHSLFF